MLKQTITISAFAFATLAMVSAMVSCRQGNGRATKVLDKWALNDSIVNAPEITAGEGTRFTGMDDCTNFTLQGQACAEDSAEAAVLFHCDSTGGGYEMLIHNGGIDGTRKTGSLSTVRNLYYTTAKDRQWFDFTISVRGNNISITIDSTEVVCYTEPGVVFRLPQYKNRRLGHGKIAVEGRKGKVTFRNMKLTQLSADAKNPNDTLKPVYEPNDGAIRLQQKNFPVIDWHVHLKGGLTQAMAEAKAKHYGINYGVAVNLGEGGIGTMLADDKEATEYLKKMAGAPFMLGAQGEGRRWSTKFSQAVLARFDYLFTDAMTIVDKGKICRIYRPEEVHPDGRTKEQYMDMLVDQTVKILTYEPVDIYVNPTFLPETMQGEYDKLWTGARINRLLDVLCRYGIALEINSRYKLPSYKIISMAKARGIKFTFGTNNENPDFGQSEYAIGAVNECGLTAGDMWFPPMSRRAGRKAVDYNHFGSAAKPTRTNQR